MAIDHIGDFQLATVEFISTCRTAVVNNDHIIALVGQASERLDIKKERYACFQFIFPPDI
jgi:hypothetical protein